MTDELEKRVEQLEEQVQKLKENQEKLVYVAEKLSNSVGELTDSLVVKEYMKLRREEKFDEFKEKHPEDAEQVKEIAHEFLSEESET